MRLFTILNEEVPKNLMEKTHSLTLCSRHAPPKQSAQSRVPNPALPRRRSAALGHISGGHFNPAVTIGLWIGGRNPTREVVPYIVFQVAGAIAAAAVLKIMAEGHPGFVLGGFTSNGYGDLSPGHYNLLSCAVIETDLTFFLTVILGTTSTGAPASFAVLATGLALTIIHLISIPVTDTSVYPARSTGPAIFASKAYIEQLWFFWLVWLAPIAGAVVAGIFSWSLFRKPVRALPS